MVATHGNICTKFSTLEAKIALGSYSFVTDYLLIRVDIGKEKRRCENSARLGT